MNRVLVIADGKVAKKFIQRVVNKELQDLKFTIAVKDENFVEDLNSDKLEYEIIDPTSLYRLRAVCLKYDYNSVFIVMQNSKEAFTVYKNIRKLNEKIRVVALDTDDLFIDIDDSYVNILNSNEILANRLYDFLPNVPLVGQSIGLNQGEIMEILVPFASSFSYRHVSSIPQKKWKIAAIYRDNKLLLPTNATLVKPRDRLLIVGNPNVLNNVYKKIKNKSSQFPEPYGKNFYLLIDIAKDGKNSFVYIQEAIYLLDKFKNKDLIIRVTNPSDLKLVKKIKEFEKDNIKLFISYEEMTEGKIFTDIQNYDIGLIMTSNNVIKNRECLDSLNNFKKLIYLFGNTRLNRVKESIIINTQKKEIEEISTVAFYIAEALNIKLKFVDYNPSGDFKESKNIIEHIEILSQVHSYPVDIIQENKNPLKAIKKIKDTLIIIPFKGDIKLNIFLSIIKRDIISLIFKTNTHPKLLIPIRD